MQVLEEEMCKRVCVCTLLLQ
ncbi:hypothetical protein LINPERPRIM_LOCUS13948 [Linum perenne]